MKERQIIINKTSYFATFLYHLRDYLPIRVHYPHRIYPFTGFTFFNQAPYSSVIQGEGTLQSLGNRVCRPYARYSPPVCSVFIARIPNTWETFAQRQKNDNRPSPSIADEQSSEAKGEGGERDEKHTKETF